MLRSGLGGVQAEVVEGRPEGHPSVRQRTARMISRTNNKTSTMRSSSTFIVVTFLSDARSRRLSSAHAARVGEKYASSSLPNHWTWNPAKCVARRRFEAGISGRSFWADFSSTAHRWDVRILHGPPRRAVRPMRRARRGTLRSARAKKRRRPAWGRRRRALLAACHEAVRRRRDAGHDHRRARDRDDPVGFPCSLRSRWWGFEWHLSKSYVGSDWCRWYGH